MICNRRRSALRAARSFVRGLGAVLAALSMPAVATRSTAQAQTAIQTTRVASGLSRPVFVASPPGDASRLFIVEQHTGQIKILNLATNTVEAAPFLDIDDLSTDREQGLLGLAFHPDYANNGQFYVNLTVSGSGATHVRRYTRSATNPNLADPATMQTVLTYDQPEINHNGGWLAFNPRIQPNESQYLYIAAGDGGGGNDQHGAIGNAQDTTGNLLGKLLRIDVDGDDFPADAIRNYRVPATNPLVGTGSDGEIWDYGLRNPWRPSFDRQTGDLYIADVGQSAREEVNFEPRGAGGRNYGWRVMEGTRCNVATDPIPCNDPQFTPPIHEYNHNAAGGFSISGGYVYRGPVAALQGHYFFADYASDRVWSFRYDGANKTEFQERTTQFVTNAGTITDISSFGEDAVGNLYVVDLTGEVFRIDSARPALVSAGATWRYLDDGSNLGTAWREAGFGDGAWRTGAAQLGYGEGDEITVVDCGPAAGNECSPTNNPASKYATTYLRRHFNVNDPSIVESLTLGLLRDDGAAVYLNGQQIVRTSNLAPDAAFDALADFNNAAAVSGADETTFFPFPVDPALLVAGDNVLAVEIHQHMMSSSDVSFDLRLSATYKSLTPGDADRDGDVDRAAVAAVAANFGRTSAALHDQGDFNDDGRVGLADLALLQSNFVAPAGAAVPIPEPATIVLAATGLIAMGLAACLRRRNGRARRSFAALYRAIDVLARNGRPVPVRLANLLMVATAAAVT